MPIHRADSGPAVVRTADPPSSTGPTAATGRADGVTDRPPVTPTDGFEPPRTSATFGARSGAAAHNADLATFRRMLSGEVPVADGMREIAHRGGWPIALPNGFLVAVPDDGGGELHLAGDHNGWQREAMRRERGLRWIHVEADPERASRYKLVDEGGTFRADPWARCYGYDRYGEYSMTRASGPHLERWPELSDGVVPPRTVRVWVPAGKPTHQLYLQDGQNLFDPEAMGGGWRLQSNLGPNTLAIGIDNIGAGRVEEYTHVADHIDGEWSGGGGDAYADFVQKTVRPFIEARYGAPAKVGILGSSLGGLVAYHVARRYPEAFDFVGSMSGTFGWGKLGDAHRETMIDRYEGFRPQRPIFYLDSGGEPGGADNYDDNRRLADAMAAAGLSWNERLLHWHEPEAPHNEAAWAARVRRPLKVFEGL